MRKWRYQMGIHDLLVDEDVTGEAFVAVRDSIVAKAREAPDHMKATGAGMHLDLILDEMADTENVAEFNNVLDALYDWGDAYSVWIG